MLEEERTSHYLMQAATTISYQPTRKFWNEITFIVYVQTRKIVFSFFQWRQIQVPFSTMAVPLKDGIFWQDWHGKDIDFAEGVESVI
jgi:hypothetical protein